MKQTYDFSQLDFSRIAVIGSAGSGKTTFSNSMGNLLQREVIHLDKILWGENWQELSHEQHVEILSHYVNQPRWIIDGMWKSTLEMKYKKSTLVVFLHYNRLVCVWRAFWRSLKHRGKQRGDMAKGCVEKVNFGFYRYIWNFSKNTLPVVKQTIQKYPDVKLLTLKTPKQTKKFLKALQSFLEKAN